MQTTTQQTTVSQTTVSQTTGHRTIPATRTPAEVAGTGPDLVGYQLVHAAMLRDVQRFADLADRIAAGATDVSRDRAHAIRDYLRLLFTAITHHHEGEDALVWPVIADRVADPAAMAQLTVDHQQLDPLFDEVLIAAERLTVDPASRLAADELAGWMRRLASGLDAHIALEEQIVFPVLRERIPVAEYEQMEAQVRKDGSLADLTFVVPWMAAVATEDQRERALAKAGRPFRVLLALTRRGYARRERAVFGR
jgi:hemerythrin-like domain-containing protein